MISHIPLSKQFKILPYSSMQKQTTQLKCVTNQSVLSSIEYVKISIKGKLKTLKGK